MTQLTAEPRKVVRRHTSLGTVLAVVPDAAAIARLAGSLGYLSARKYRVHLGVLDDPPGALSLALYERYPGLTVERLPLLADERWTRLRATVSGALRRLPDGSRLERPLRTLVHAVPPPAEAVALLEDVSPDLLLVTRLGEGRHVDYLKAARARRIRSVFLSLDWDDVVQARLSEGVPDCAAVWNRAQRREAIEQGVPARRTCVIGAHLETDVLDVRTAGSRAEYYGRLGVREERRVVLLAPPRTDAADVRGWIQACNAARLAHADPATRESSVVVFTRSRDAAAAVALAGLPGVAAVIDADPQGDAYTAARQLHEALTHAAAVVTADPAIALEGIARACPVVAVAADDADRLGRLCARMRQEYEWPLVTRTIEEQAGGLAAALSRASARDGLAAARGFVRIHGGEVEPAFLLISRVIRELPPPPAPEPAPLAYRRAAAWLATASRAVTPRPAARGPSGGGKALFLLALPAASAVDLWESLMRALVERGHRVLVVIAPEVGASRAGRPAKRRVIQGVAMAGVLNPRTGGWQRVAVGAAAVRLFLPALQARSAAAVRWRARLEGVQLPAWVRGVQALSGRGASLDRVRRCVDVFDANVRSSRAARCLIERHQPDVVVALPALGGTRTVESWAAHTDLLRAARARGIPAATSLLGGRPIDDALANCALRARGLSRANAEIAAADLEAWLNAETRQGAGRTPRSILALLAGVALAPTIWTGVALRAIEARVRPIARTAQRLRGAAGAAVRRLIRSDVWPGGPPRSPTA